MTGALAGGNDYILGHGSAGRVLAGDADFLQLGLQTGRLEGGGIGDFAGLLVDRLGDILGCLQNLFVGRISPALVKRCAGGVVGGPLVLHIFPVIIVAESGNFHLLALQNSFADLALHNAVIAAGLLAGSLLAVLLDGVAGGVRELVDLLCFAAQLDLALGAVHHAVIAAFLGAGGLLAVLLDGVAGGVIAGRVNGDSSGRDGKLNRYFLQCARDHGSVRVRLYADLRQSVLRVGLDRIGQLQHHTVENGVGHRRIFPNDGAAGGVDGKGA